MTMAPDGWRWTLWYGLPHPPARFCWVAWLAGFRR